MTGYVPPPLHPLLGRDFDAITETELGSLVGASETEWFDAKRDLYGGSEGQRRELAIDVAAFANRNGGVIVIGLEEDGNGRVTALAPVAEHDLANEEVRITQIVSSLVSPVPAFTVRKIASSGDTAFVLVSVAPSVRRPHCVAVNAETVRFPLREGSHKRYLTESEIADMYRNRFVDARAHTDQVQERHQAMVDELDRSQMAWLVMSLEPDWPGHFTVTHTNTDDLRDFGRTERVEFPNWFQGVTYTPSPSFRSLRLYDDHDQVQSTTARLNLDGAGALAYGWEWRPQRIDDDSPKIAYVADEDIVGCLVNGLWSLSRWAIDWTGTTGDATLLVELHAPEDYPVTLHAYRTGRSGRLRGARNLETRTGLVEMTVSLDGLRSSAVDLLLVARQVTAELESAFGVLGPPQVSRSGAVRWRFFHSNKHDLLRKWADAWGVEVLEDANED